MNVYPEKITAELKKLCAKSPAIKRQFYFDEAEKICRNNELKDPIGDEEFSPIKGIVQRYRNRVLFLPHNICPANCRFCFRKNVLNSENNLTDKEIEEAIDFIENDKKINEVIFSGGEFLSLPIDKINSTLQKIDLIKHIKSVRIHTRITLSSPQKANEIADNMFLPKKPLFIVIHCNHYSEITSQTKKFVDKMLRKKITILSQTVLLKSVNANVKILQKTFEKLLENQILPYQLHHLDYAIGTSHFRVSLEDGQKIYQELSHRISGLALPKYILDLPQGLGKIQANSNEVSKFSDGLYCVNLPHKKSTIFYYG